MCVIFDVWNIHHVKHSLKNRYRYSKEYTYHILCSLTDPVPSLRAAAAAAAAGRHRSSCPISRGGVDDCEIDFRARAWYNL